MPILIEEEFNRCINWDKCWKYVYVPETGYCDLCRVKQFLILDTRAKAQHRLTKDGHYPLSVLEEDAEEIKEDIIDWELQ